MEIKVGLWFDWNEDKIKNLDGALNDFETRKRVFETALECSIKNVIEQHFKDDTDIRLGFIKADILPEVVTVHKIGTPIKPATKEEVDKAIDELQKGEPTNGEAIKKATEEDRSS